MSDRVKEVVPDLIYAIRSTLKKHGVTFEEYGAAMQYLIRVQETGEVPLFVDAFFNATIVEIDNVTREGTQADIQGPYYLNSEAYQIISERLPHRPIDENAQDMVIRGQITDTDGNPLAGAELDIWHSTPDGLYSGVHDGIDAKYCRGRVITDAQGRYSVKSKLPVPYQIPNQGPTGELLEQHLGRHSWRPAHIHFWARADGRRDLINQAYFENGEWVGDDCCETDHLDLVVPELIENGARVMEVNFALDPALAIAAE
ncbi:dioxygenase family protein [Tritonibacter horizontis]|jgi:chlorocatechol 1,2-dioxygenase|uniref:Chlorocatechol 1,2-dioxygenase n=1 Tax=Tritonibacter horizontis TaxID=1768241 RepID=A0A132C263_9RHOB|nr:dioxygenase [Tritonibacter horizontis]KUP94207.1 chlorocatechol 1,2-dioxygenase [Tritonibacter horizontis]